MTRIYTRTGDDGTTGLFGGPRVAKSHPRIEAYGAVDETNAHLGRARVAVEQSGLGSELNALLERLQEELFVLGAELATPSDASVEIPRIERRHVDEVEDAIDRFQADLPELDRFVLPGGTGPGSDLHVARTTCRRAERALVRADEEIDVRAEALQYVNRLSDLLFVLARWVNHRKGIPDEKWTADLAD